MKKTIIVAILAALMLSGCNNADDTTLGSSDSVVEIQSGEDVHREEEVKNIANEYINRVYNIDYKTYNPEYIDESTTVDEMKKVMTQLKVKCDIKNILFVEVDFINNSTVEIIAITTADYGSDLVEMGEYYIPIAVDLEKIDEEWTVMSSEWMSFASTSTHELVKNKTSGYYEFVPIQPKTNTEGGIQNE